MIKSKITKGILLLVILSASVTTAAADCTYTLDNEWGTGFVASITITNKQSSIIDNWQVGWRYSDGSSVVSSWNAKLSGSNPYQAKGVNWNSKIQPGNSVSFGLQGVKGITGGAAEIPEISGNVCSSTNTAPNAKFSVTDHAGLAQSFDASNSSDAQNDQLTYRWSIEGSNYTTVNPQHTFSKEGIYLITLTVSDGKAADTVTQSIEVTDIPDDTDMPTDDFIGHNVAVLYFKDKEVSASIDKSDVQYRIENSVDEMIRYNSYGHEGFAQVDDLGWFEFDSSDFAGILGRSKWYEQDIIVDSVNSGMLDFTGYDYIFLVFDDTRNTSGPNGSTFATPRELVIGDNSFGVKPYINMYMKSYTMQDHCFYKSQIYKDYELCYPNLDGEPLKRFDSTLVHEFIHSKQFGSHSITKYCDEQLILGKCITNNYNMFDLLSSSRFFGTSMLAYNRHKAGWLRKEHIKSLSGTGSFEVTLDHLNSLTGFNAAKIEVDGWDKELWLEFRLPGEFDYGLYQPEFDKITSGLLLYENNTLLNGGSGEFDELNVAVTDAIDINVLGINIEILQVDKANGQITFSVDLSGLVPTKTVPLEESVRCKSQGNRCKVKQGEELQLYYQFEINDIGFGQNSEKLWEFEFIGLPEGLTYTNTPINRQVASYPGAYSRTPNTEVTFRANSMEEKVYQFTMRVYNPADRNLYLDIPQYIKVE